MVVCSWLHDGCDVLCVAGKPHRGGQSDSTATVQTARDCTLRLFTELYRRLVTVIRRPSLKGSQSSTLFCFSVSVHVVCVRAASLDGHLPLLTCLIYICMIDMVNKLSL